MTGSLILPGINVQWPWSELLMSGEKTVETRHYPLPPKFKGQEMALIETAGPKGRDIVGKARIIGTIVFSDCFEYSSRTEWQKDIARHCVPNHDPLYGYQTSRKKYGWVVERVQRAVKSVRPPKNRGIIYTTKCEVPESVLL